MRVAALYDIHGNLPALEAVLREVRAAGVERIVVGGDVIPGPLPREILAALRELGIPVLYLSGDGEREVLTRAAERIRATSYPQAEEFAARNILQPPSESEMLNLFT